MASNHTTNYQLNQWEATDQVLRTDFNEDNAKIDWLLKSLSDQVAQLTQTVAGKAEAGDLPYVKLREYTVSQPAKSVALDLSGLNLAAYPALRFEAASGGYVESEIGLRVNGLSEGYEYRTASSLNPIDGTMITLGGYGEFSSAVELRPFGEWLSYYADGIYYYSDRVTGFWSRGVHPKVSYGELASVSMVCEEPDKKVAAGTRVILYGLRK